MKPETRKLNEVAKYFVGEEEHKNMRGSGLSARDIISLAGRRGGSAKSPDYYLNLILEGKAIIINGVVVVEGD